MAVPRTFSSTRAARTSFWVVAAVSALLPVRGEAQAGCVFGEGSSRVRTEPDPRGGSISRLTTPHFECDDDVEIWADSAVAYSIDAMSLLYGSVRYVDRQREMRADNARYFSEVGRLQAQGHVLITNFEDGSIVENGDLVYLRQTDYRDVEEMTVTTGSDGLRPKATVYPKRAEPPVDDPSETTSVEADPGGEPIEPDAPPPEALEPAVTVEPPAATDPEPVQAEEPTEPAGPEEPVEPEEYVVVGDKLVFRGNSYFNATGSVEIERDSLFAFADSAEYSGDLGQLALEGSARVEGSSYDLVGRTITLASAADGTDEIRALREAVLTGEDLRVTASQIILDLVDGEIDHMVAVPIPDEDEDVLSSEADALPRPLAISGDIELTGDSLDLAAPAGAIERIFAAGDARSVSSGRADLNVSSLPELARTDWIDADSIEVMLVPLASDSSAEVDSAAGSSNGYEVDRIIARVQARSLYRLLPADSSAVMGVDPPAVSYIVADQITIFMVEGQADRVESVGQVSGWHLEPLTSAPADSLTQPDPADSTATPLATGTVPAAASVDPTGDNRGDGPLPGTYLSPVARAPQAWRLQ